MLPSKTEAKGTLKMNRSFNADFYVVAATVLPVLYLAVVLEGSLYRELLHRAEKAWVILKRPYEVYIFWRLIAYAIWSLWVTGEVLAVCALYERTSIVGFSGPLVFSALIVLVVAVTAGPAWAFYAQTPRPGNPRTSKH